MLERLYAYLQQEVTLDLRALLRRLLGRWWKRIALKSS
jgi:hypothetical protein